MLPDPRFKNKNQTKKQDNNGDMSVKGCLDLIKLNTVTDLAEHLNDSEINTSALNKKQTNSRITNPVRKFDGLGEHEMQKIIKIFEEEFLIFKANEINTARKQQKGIYSTKSHILKQKVTPAFMKKCLAVLESYDFEGEIISGSKFHRNIQYWNKATFYLGFVFEKIIFPILGNDFDRKVIHEFEINSKNLFVFDTAFFLPKENIGVVSEPIKMGNRAYFSAFMIIKDNEFSIRMPETFEINKNCIKKNLEENGKQKVFDVVEELMNDLKYPFAWTLLHEILTIKNSPKILFTSSNLIDQRFMQSIQTACNFIEEETSVLNISVANFKKGCKRMNPNYYISRYILDNVDITDLLKPESKLFFEKTSRLEIPVNVFIDKAISAATNDFNSDTYELFKEVSDNKLKFLKKQA